MNLRWALVVVAAIFEVMWVVGLKHADSVLTWGLTMIGIIVSFGLLIYSGKKLPTSTVYAIFVGLGTAGTVVMEMVWFNEPFRWLKIALIALLLGGVIGLKLVTHEKIETDPKMDAAL